MHKAADVRIRMPRKKRRQQLINVALQLFGQKGYRGTTTKDISRKARISESVIYSHFRSKKELFIAVIQHVYKGLEEVWEAIDPFVIEKPYDFLLTVTDISYKYVINREHIMPFFSRLHAEMAEPEFRVEFRNIYENVYNFINEAIENDSNSNHFRSNLDVEMVVWLLVNSLLTLASATYVAPDLVRPDMPQRLLGTLLGLEHSK